MKYQRAFASEIDHYASAVSRYNHPDVYEMGDVLDIDRWYEGYTEGVDLLLAGVPCQPFSFAGNQLAFNDERAKPTIEFFKLFHKWKPKWWLVEETPMKKEYQDIFSREFGCEPRVHNSASVSAQNRKRLYWTNIPHDDLPNLNINLEDILEDESMTDREKAYCIDANYFKGGSMKMYFEKSRRQLVFNHDQKCKQVGEADLKGYDMIVSISHHHLLLCKVVGECLRLYVVRGVVGMSLMVFVKITR
jgi:site-specific DNA-cytosine methylase